MSFFLQLGHPKINQGSFPVFEQVREIFVHLFRAEEESIYLFWYQIPLRFRYREDLHHSFDNILSMVWLIQRDEQGTTKVEFITQLLSIHWEIRWEGDGLVIRSTFTELDDLYAPYAQTLNQYPEVQMEKQAFLSEWKTLLHQIIVAFRSGHVEIQDGVERRKWEMLQRVEHQIAQYGQLYIRQA
ncbi:MAG: hypothetical protein GY792_25520 [Gammaproteobacteria bacterium]|nr:hypothetical protein [Gammaproteobacteria bacterium]